MLIISLGFMGSASAQQNGCPDPIPDKLSANQIIACFPKMLEKIIQLEAALKSKSAVPSGSIVMTENECATLGLDWSVYKNAGGRFPIGAGATTDINSEKRQFVVGHPDNVGEYRHRITVPEMPSHTHFLPTDTIGNSSMQTLYNTPQSDEGLNNLSRKSGASGGNIPHNNIPPYVTLNFCQKQ